MMKPEFAEELKNKALATFARTDAPAQADTAQVLKLEDGRWSGQYVILRTAAGSILAVYKFSLRMGPARGQRTGGGGVAYVVSSFSTSLKRLKRWPKELLTDAAVVA